LDLIELKENSMKENKMQIGEGIEIVLMNMVFQKKAFQKLKSEKFHASLMNTSVACATDPSVNSSKHKFH
jgi:hypothetical protein